MWSLVVCLAVAVLVLLLLDTVKPSLFPPGPRWWPVVGWWMGLKRRLRSMGFTHLVWNELALEYGPLVGLRLGRDRLVIASGFENVRAVLNSPQFDARPDGYFFRLRSFGERFGLVFVDGEFFNEQKKFCVKHLRDLGFGKSEMESRILFEVSELIEDIKNSLATNKSLLIPDKLEISILNNLWTLVAGDRIRPGDCRMAALMRCIHTSFRLQDMSGGILNQMPFVRFLAPEGSTYKQLINVLNSLINFIKELVDEHRTSQSPQYAKRDLIDAFLQEMKSSQEKSTFSEKQLIMLLLDLLLAGAETTVSTLGFALIYLVRDKELQNRLAAEIDSVVGHDVQPNLSHRRRMKQVEAFLMEVHRHANVTPTTVSHRALSDAKFGNYIIPKDTIVIANLYSQHMDKEHWGDPEVFRIDRFLDKEGKLIQDEHLMPFGSGKRRCMGEGLAKASLFLYLTSILRNFTLTLPEGHPPPSLVPNDGATLSPKSFECVFTLRKTTSNDVMNEKQVN